MKRSKANRKAMQAYTTTFGFRTPYQVLGEEIYPLRFVLALRGADAEGRMNGQTVDADFVLKCASQKIEVLERLATVLGGKVKPMISQCSIEELYKLGSDGQAAVDLARSQIFSRKKCNHWDKNSSDNCIKGILGDDNKLRFMVATQSAPLREHLRNISGTPLLYINSSSALILEPLSEASASSKSKKDDFKTHVSAQEAQELSLATPLASTSQQSIIGQGGPDDLGPVSSRPSTAMLTAEALLDKKKRAKQRSKKGPNPLSVKKSKSKRKKTSSMSAVKESEEAQKQGKPKERKMRKKAKDRMTSGSGAEKEASSAN